MKRSRKSIIAMLSILFIGSSLMSACSSQNTTPPKSGAQLWGENCIRCHNAPPPSAFSDDQWEIVAMHMKVRANLNSHETSEIVDFLQMAN